jgi:protein-tyrosine phosphatase
MKVLFVCAGNAHRSPLAEALLKKLRPEVQADSAGLHVAIPISEEARRYLTRENAQQYLKKVPESLEQKNLNQYDLIVVMEQRHKDAVTGRCPECADKIMVWNIQDPYFLPPEYGEKIYEQIRQKVKELADSL